MMGDTHERVVQAAVSVAKPASGKNADLRDLPDLPDLPGPVPQEFKEAFGAFLTAVGAQSPAAAAGTDTFGDLSISSRWLIHPKPQPEAFGQCFTKFSHFIDMSPFRMAHWRGRNGYSYAGSPKVGLDKVVMQGLSSLTGAGIDQGASQMLRDERLPEDWIPAGDDDPLAANFDGLLTESVFPPVSSLARYYYKQFRQAPLDLFRVDGPSARPSRGGPWTLCKLQFLGPVFHAIADACVPMHLRATLDYGHQEWEKMLECRVKKGTIGADRDTVFALAGSLWQAAGFGSDPVPGSPGPDLGDLVMKVADCCLDRVTKALGGSVQKLWAADCIAWWEYTCKSFASDEKSEGWWHYQLAVAGSICAIVYAFRDLRVGPAKLDEATWPKLLNAGPAGGQGIRVDKSRRGADESAAWVDPFAEAKSWLGFDPGVELKSALADLGTCLGSPPVAAMASQSDVDQKILAVRAAMAGEFYEQDRKRRGGFCPFEEALLADSTGMSPEFGIATFRPPDETELAEHYMRAAEPHRQKACIFLGAWAEATGCLTKGLLSIAQDGPARRRAPSLRRFQRRMLSSVKPPTLVIPTFDDGPVASDFQKVSERKAGEDPVDALLQPLQDILSALRGPAGGAERKLAVFYVSWPQLPDDPHAPSMAQEAFDRGLKAIRADGHVIAMHSYCHWLYRNLFLADSKTVRDDLEALEGKLKDYCPLWRPPYGGAWTPLVSEATIAAEMKLTHRTWRIDSFDWCYHADGLFPGIDPAIWSELVKCSLGWDVAFGGGIGSAYADILMHVNRRTPGFLGTMFKTVQGAYDNAWGAGCRWATPSDRDSDSFKAYLGTP